MDGGDDEGAEESDDRGVIVLPLGLSDVESGVDPAQHLAGTETGASSPQHLSAPNAGSSSAAPQHLAAPNAGTSTATAPQHGPTTEVSNAPQHLQSSSKTQHLAGAEHGADATNPGNAGLQGPKPHNTGLHRLRHLSKIQIAVAAATTAALVAVGAIILSAQHDDPQAVAPPATNVAIVETAATVETQTPPAPPRTTTSAAAPTTTAAPSAAFSGGAGTYDVTSSPTHITGDGFPPHDVPSNNGGGWILVGPCDGVGDCTITVLATSGPETYDTGAPRDADGNIVFPMTPSGDGGYVSNFSVVAFGCAGTGSLTATGIAQGQITAMFTLVEGGGERSTTGGTCTASTSTVDFTATRSG